MSSRAKLSRGKKISIISVAVLALLALAVTLLYPYLPLYPTKSKDPQEAARYGVRTFKALINQSNYKDFGFESLDEKNRITLGQPFRVVMVRLDQLIEYQPEKDDPQKLYTEVGRIIYPVLVDQKVRSSLEIHQTGEEWQGSSFGNPRLIVLLDKYRKQETDFVAWIPALSKYFIATEPSGNVLVSIVDDPELNLTVGQALPIEEVFQRIHIAVSTGTPKP